MSLEKAEGVLRNKVHTGAPKKFIEAVLKQVKTESNIFVNGKITNISNHKLEYYRYICSFLQFRLLKEVYVTIIRNWNSSVSNVFIDAFKLKTEGRERKIFRSEMKDFLTKVMRLDITYIQINHRYLNLRNL